MSDSLTYILSGLTFAGGLVLAYVGVYAMDCLSKPSERRRQVNLAVAREASETVRLQTLQMLFPEKKYQVKEKETILIETTKGDKENTVLSKSSKKTNEDYHLAESPQESDDDAEKATNEEEALVDEENQTKRDSDENAAADNDDVSDSHPTVDEEEMDDVCAICIEHFQQDEFVMEGLECHHEYHRSCMMEWLYKHNDCPVCRKSMWTRDAFQTAKKQVLKANPQLVKTEMEAAQAVEDTMETAALGAASANLAAAEHAGNDDDIDQEYDEENPTITVTATALSSGVL